MSKCCVYRYMVGDQWIYVGKADGTIHKRIAAHAKETRFQPYLESCQISYFEFEHVSDMTHAEAALIKIQKPVLNISGKNDSHFPFSINTDALQWIEYKSPKEIREEKKRKEEEEKQRIAEEKKKSELESRLVDLERWKRSYFKYLEDLVEIDSAEAVISQIKNHLNNPPETGEIELILPSCSDDRFDMAGFTHDHIKKSKVQCFSFRCEKDKTKLRISYDSAIDAVRYWAVVSSVSKVTVHWSEADFHKELEKYGTSINKVFALYEKTKKELATCA